MMSGMRAVIAVLLVAGLALAVTLGGTAAARSSTTISVGDDFFSPDKKKIKKGTKVKFDWIGTDKHDVVKKSGPGKGFDSGPIDTPGVNFKHKFKKAGKYKIICTIHDGMKLTLKVK